MKITKRPVKYDGDLFYILICYLDEIFPEEDAPRGAHLIRNKSSRYHWIENLGYILAAKKELCKRLCTAPPWDDVEDVVMGYLDDIVLRQHLCRCELNNNRKSFVKHIDMCEQGLIVAYSALDFLDGFRV